MNTFTQEQLERMARSIVEFGNLFLRDSVVPHIDIRVRNFKYHNAELKTGRHFYFLSYNPITKNICLSLEKYIQKFELIKNAFEFEIILATLIFEEFGRHMQNLLHKRAEDTTKEWRDRTADYLAGYMLYYFLKFKKLSTVVRPIFLYKIPFASIHNDFETEFSPESVSEHDRNTFNKEKASAIELGFREAKNPENIREFFRTLW